MEGDKAILPIDIIIEILTRLPVKSLIRFQSVCRSWKILVETPSFITKHLHHSSHKNPYILTNAPVRPSRSPQPLYLLDCNTMETVGVHIVPLINSFPYYPTIVSCNGLLCVELSKNFDNYQSFLVWNPATRKVRQLQSGIVYDVTPFRLGFGFSSVLNDYTIVKIYCRPFKDDHGNEAYLQKSYISRVEVYSFCTGFWKQQNFKAIENVSLISYAAIANYETLSWLGLRNDDGHLVIVSFDITLKVFTLIPTPIISKSLKFGFQYKLTMFENKLALLHRHSISNGNFESSFIELWVMEESKSWMKKYNIGPIASWLYPKCNWKNKIVCQDTRKSSESDRQQILDDDPLKDEPRCFLYLLHPTTYEVKRFSGLNFRPSDFCGFLNYVESLVPVSNTFE